MKKIYILKLKIIIVGFFILLQSCVSKKEIFYIQDIDSYSPIELSNKEYTLQVDDILNITIGSLVPEASFPFNKTIEGIQQNNNF